MVDNCLFCNKLKVNKYTRRFCNRVCYENYTNKYGSLNFKDRTEKNRVCKYCNKIFNIESQLPFKQCCTRECFLLLKKKNSWKEILCLNCNKKIIKYMHHKGKFCDIKCYHIYRKLHMIEFHKPQQQILSLKESQNRINIFMNCLEGNSYSPDKPPRPDIIYRVDNFLIAFEIEKQKGRYLLERRLTPYIKNKHIYDLVFIISRDHDKYTYKEFNTIKNSVIKNIIKKIKKYYDTIGDVNG